MEHRILFVDDDAFVHKALKRQLGLHYSVSFAESGAKALALIESEGPFPIVFTDMRMPGMDGLELINRARELSPESIFVMLTGNCDQTTAKNARVDGKVFSFLNKPCTGDELTATIKAAAEEYDRTASAATTGERFA